VKARFQSANNINNTQETSMYKIVTVLSAVALLSACAGLPPQTSLSPEDLSAIKLVDVEAFVVQDEIIAAVKPSNVSLYAGGGLIAAAIDANITTTRVNQALELLEPFYWEIDDLDFRALLDEQARQPIMASQRLPIRSFSVSPILISNETLKEKMAALAPNEYWMTVAVNYYFSMDFRTIDVVAVASLWQHGTEIKPVYHRDFHYQSAFVGAGQADSIDKWTAEHAALFRATLAEGISQVSQFLLEDPQVGFESQPDERVSLRFNTGAAEKAISGKPIHRGDNRTVFITKAGPIFSLPAVPHAKAETGATYQ
jgi:hypothetical protein